MFNLSFFMGKVTTKTQRHEDLQGSHEFILLLTAILPEFFRMEP
jgi:hypothetical protein